MNIVEMLSEAVRQKAADIFLIPGMPFSYKISSRIESIGENKIFPEEMDKIIAQIYEIAGNRSMERVLLHGDDDFSFAIPSVSRFHASVFRQRGSLTAVIRIVTFELPDFTELHLPETVMEVAKMTKGFVLVTEPAGSGKSTTLACIAVRVPHWPASLTRSTRQEMHMSSRWKTPSSTCTVITAAW